ncbi:MAG: hypothetical protein GXP63_00520 [DPANN group archaeon]|nr:hypothetical protein [DPANN group archaeon]
MDALHQTVMSEQEQARLFRRMIRWYDLSSALHREQIAPASVIRGYQWLREEVTPETLRMIGDCDSDAISSYFSRAFSTFLALESDKIVVYKHSGRLAYYIYPIPVNHFWNIHSDPEFHDILDQHTSPAPYETISDMLETLDAYLFSFGGSTTVINDEGRLLTKKTVYDLLTNAYLYMEQDEHHELKPKEESQLQDSRYLFISTLDIMARELSEKEKKIGH